MEEYSDVVAQLIMVTLSEKTLNPCTLNPNCTPYP